MRLTKEEIQEWVDDVYEPEERDGMFRILWMDNYCHPEDIKQQYNEYLISKREKILNKCAELG